MTGRTRVTLGKGSESGWPLDWCEACWRRGGEGMNRGDFVMGPDGASERARRRHALDAQRRDVRADIKRWLD